MKTLVIHPHDKTTDFLKPIYAGIENKTVITGGVDRKYIREMIKQHDRTVMLGHGCPTGLFSVGQFKGNIGMVIDYSMVDLLKQQDNNIYIWCHADQFVNRYNLKGIYSGMFISEVGEALYCLSKTFSQDQVDVSNNLFATVLGEAIMTGGDTESIFENMLDGYAPLVYDNEIADYNYHRLYLAP